MYNSLIKAYYYPEGKFQKIYTNLKGFNNTREKNFYLSFEGQASQDVNGKKDEIL